MNYDDFPILDDSSYQILYEQYKLNSCDKNELVGEIFNALVKLESCEISNHRKMNTTLLSIINESKLSISLMINDLEKVYNISSHQTNFITNISVFKFLSNIIKIIKNIDNLLQINNNTYSSEIMNNIKTKLKEVKEECP